VSGPGGSQSYGFRKAVEHNAVLKIVVLYSLCLPSENHAEEAKEKKDYKIDDKEVHNS